MQDFIEKVYRNFKDFFLSLDFSKRLSLIGTSVLIVAALVAMMLWATKTRYEVLYSDLNKEDAQKISVLLKEKNIPYQFSDNSKVISVPSDLVDVWRLKIATMGVNFSGTVESFLGFIDITSIRLWLRHLST